jgi:CDP-2,3-bis-(O-geranylgeranyl)-sn-glycerol synthase
MEELLSVGRALLMVGTASTVPWAVGRACGDRWAAPLDFGLLLWDGKRLLGSHKTWRGFVAGVAASGLVGSFVGLDPLVGTGIGAAALAGDALSSAIKRRLDRRPGTEIWGLDQIPEALLPLWIFREPLGLSPWQVLAVVAVFMLVDLWAVPLRHRRR